MYDVLSMLVADPPVRLSVWVLKVTKEGPTYFEDLSYSNAVRQILLYRTYQHVNARPNFNTFHTHFLLKYVYAILHTFTLSCSNSEVTAGHYKALASCATLMSTIWIY